MAITEQLSAEERLHKILESRRAQSRKYYMAHRHTISDYNKQYFQANKARIYAQRRARRKAQKKEGGSDG